MRLALVLTLTQLLNIKLHCHSCHILEMRMCSESKFLPISMEITGAHQVTPEL